MSILINGKKVAGIGTPGKSAYQAAVEGGYTGSEPDFNQILANAVPNTRTINSKPLSSDITLTAEDVEAMSQDEADARYIKSSGETVISDSGITLSSQYTPSVTLKSIDEDASASFAYDPGGYGLFYLRGADFGVSVDIYSEPIPVVLQNRTINGKPLYQDITLTASDVGAGAASQSTTVTLTASGWTQSGNRYAQTVNCSIVDSDTPVVVVDVQLTGTDTDADNEALAAWAGPSANNVTQGEGTLTFYSVEAPTVNIPVNVGVG